MSHVCTSEHYSWHFHEKRSDFVIRPFVRHSLALLAFGPNATQQASIIQPRNDYETHTNMIQELRTSLAPSLPFRDELIAVVAMRQTTLESQAIMP